MIRFCFFLYIKKSLLIFDVFKYSLINVLINRKSLRFPKKTRISQGNLDFLVFYECILEIVICRSVTIGYVIDHSRVHLFIADENHRRKVYLYTAEEITHLHLTLNHGFLREYR